jgi:hypothetical protein
MGTIATLAREFHDFYNHAVSCVIMRSVLGLSVEMVTDCHGALQRADRHSSLFPRSISDFGPMLKNFFVRNLRMFLIS